jgi:hypothetical protein
MPSPASSSAGLGFSNGHKRSSGSKGKDSGDSGKGGRDQAKSDEMKASLDSSMVVSGGQPSQTHLSGRFQNTAFFRGFIKSLANLGPRNTITLEKLQSDLKEATLSPKN